MSSPKVSVVIPAYNQADLLGETVQSVLTQTYPNFEVIVVNDGSPDHTNAVIAQINDPRLKYIVHEKNLGEPTARNTGINASTGEIIAHLDGDDLYHPEKLQTHVDFLEKHPDVDVTYNPRFELNHSATTIRELWRPPLTVALSDLVLGYPFAPSDVMVRRSCLTQVGLFDATYVYSGEELNMNCRLALANCQFASVDRALNYRRRYSGRTSSTLANRIKDLNRALNFVFTDPRCPKEVLTICDNAFTNHNLALAYYALVQDDTVLGQQFLQEAFRLQPSIVDGRPSGLVKFLLKNSTDDENLDHGELLQRIFAQLPDKMSHLSEQYDWAVARGYVLKGVRAIIWEREGDGRIYFEQAAKLNAQIDEAFLRNLAAHLANYEVEFGTGSAEDIVHKLCYHLEEMDCKTDALQLSGIYLINRAFQDYQAGNYQQVSGSVWGAISQNPGYLANRGVLSILLRSMLRKM